MLTFIHSVRFIESNSSEPNHVKADPNIYNFNSSNWIVCDWLYVINYHTKQLLNQKEVDEFLNLLPLTKASPQFVFALGRVQKCQDKITWSELWDRIDIPPWLTDNIKLTADT